MGTWKRLLSGLMVLATASVLFAAVEEGEGEAPRKRPRRERPARERRAKERPARPSECQAMIQELKLGEDVAPKVKALYAELDKALGEWDKANAQKRKELMAAMKEARGDKEKSKEIREQMSALMTTRAAIEKPLRERIMALLTEPQKLAWKGYMLCRQQMGRLRRAKLTPEQTAKIRALCDEAAKNLAKIEAGTDKKAQAKALREANTKLQADILGTLSEEQQAQLKARRGNGGGRRKPRNDNGDQ